MHTANELWDQIQFFGGYGFNRAHAVGYAMLTYLTAYLKTHYPLEYYAALLSFKGEDEDERRKYIYEARKGNINILNPDINFSMDKCNIINDSIYLPLTFIKGIGMSACMAIIRERSNGGFTSYDDFCNRIAGGKVNKNAREKLIKAGAFDSLEDRAGLLGITGENSDTEMATAEGEALGFCASDDLFDDYWYDDGTLHIGEVADLSLEDEFMTIGIVEDVHEKSDRNGDLMAFIKLTDNTGQLELTIFASIYDCPLAKGDLILVTAKLSSYKPLRAIAVSFNVLSAAVEA